MKKRSLLAGSLLILSLLFTACTGTKEDQIVENPETAVNEEVSQEVVTEAQKEEETSKKMAEIRTVALKGPTAMGMVDFMKKNDQGELTDYTYNFSIVSAVDEVAPLLVKKEVDIAAIPANLASVLYHNTEGEIQVLAVNTLGVLYLVGAEELEGIDSLKGKTIYASGKGATPEYALNYILQENGIDPNTEVTIEWKSEHTECLTSLLAKEDAIALLPQPFVTTALVKNEALKVIFDLNKEWEKLQEGKEEKSALLTGVIVGRKEFIEQNQEAVKAYLKHYENSVAFVNENIDEAAVLVEEYDIVPKEIAQKAIPGCNIVYIDGIKMKEQLSGYLKVLQQQNPKAVGGKLPEELFYYIAKE